MIYVCSYHWLLWGFQTSPCAMLTFCNQPLVEPKNKLQDSLLDKTKAFPKNFQLRVCLGVPTHTLENACLPKCRIFTTVLNFGKK